MIEHCTLRLGNGRRGHYERGLFTGGISGISKILVNSLESLENGQILLCSPQCGGFSRISKLSRISGKWAFLKRPLFQKTLADCVDSSPPLISWKFQGFGRIWANSGKFRKFRENSGELSGIQWGFVTKSGVPLPLSVLCFPASGYLGTPKHCKTRENAK